MRRGFPAGRRRRAGERGEGRDPGRPPVDGLGEGPAAPPRPPAEVLAPAEGRACGPVPEVRPPPQVCRADLHRLSEGANGLNLWGYITADPLCRVLGPGYFAPVAAWLAPFDRILVTAGAGGRQPGHATLVVAGQSAEGPRVQRLKA